MQEKQTEQVNMSLYSSVPLNTTLFDFRPGRYGIKFGTVIEVCNQFGITCELMPNKSFKFSAPKLRLLKFMEMLHFSKTRYWK